MRGRDPTSTTSISSLSSPILALHLFFHLSAVSVTADPCSCFCSASIVSNELRRNTPQEEWQPVVMFPPFLLLCSNHTHTTFVKPQKWASTLWIVWIYAICANGIIVWTNEGLRVFSGKWGVYGKNSSCLQIPTAKGISFGVGRFFLSVHKERLLVKIKNLCLRLTHPLFSSSCPISGHCRNTLSRISQTSFYPATFPDSSWGMLSLSQPR